MDSSQVKPGLRVKTTKLGETTGMLIHARYLRARDEGMTGRVAGFVPGHGGDVWWVEQDDGTTGAYCFTEFEPEV